MTSPETTEPALFLRRLERALWLMPPADRASIVAEIEAHIRERRSTSGSDASALAGLGSPEALARAFLQDRELAAAMSRSSAGPLLAAVLARAGRSLGALLVGGLAVLLYTFAASFALVAVAKPVAPTHVGLWTSPAGPAFGLLSAPGAPAAERLGIWIVPLCIVAAIACNLAATVALRAFGATRRRSGPALAGLGA